jgi:hypothetical protein
MRTCARYLCTETCNTHILMHFSNTPYVCGIHVLRYAVHILMRCSNTPYVCGIQVRRYAVHILMRCNSTPCVCGIYVRRYAVHILMRCNCNNTRPKRAFFVTQHTKFTCLHSKYIRISTLASSTRRTHSRKNNSCLGSLPATTHRIGSHSLLL